jgi:two-component system, OmpR family, sensor kinase
MARFWPPQEWLRRLPIRWRLTLIFAGVMTVLLAGLIAFLHQHLRSDLDYNINQSLRARAQDVAGIVRQDDEAGGRNLRQLPTSPSNAVQVLDFSGRVLGASGGSAQAPLLRGSELASASRVPALIERGDTVRLYALPLPSHGKIVVTAVALAERDAALDKLDAALLIAVPPALVLATLAAYWLTAAALRPVEQMRLRAATISTERLETRLPLGESEDEITRLGHTLNRMLDRLEEGMAHERMFIANASHELRMPLAVLKAELEVALRERGGAAPLRDAIGSAIEETDRITRLAEDLLLLARAEEGTLPIAPLQMPAEELVADLGTKLEPAAMRAGRGLRLETGTVHASVRVDPDRLQQAITNLVDNSLRYGSGPITLSVSAAGDAVEIHVADQGPGFSEEFLPHAFDRFTRADASRPRGGVGLGLAIVQTIARAHGGEAGARNLPTGGADVWLRLPAVAAPVGEAILSS